MKVYFLILLIKLLLTISFNLFAITKPHIQLAKNYQKQDIDINQYWVSEKLDGVRGYWNGKKLLTKQGKVIAAPYWFTKNWPQQPLDGELWIARNKFEETLSCTMQVTPNKICWQTVKFMIFDLPASKEQFSQRIKQMANIVEHINNPYIQMIRQDKLLSITEIEAKLNKVIAAKGEGLMLHKGNSYYTVGRTNNILKVKKKHDAEAVVIEHIAGKGKYHGMLGSLKVKNQDNIIFYIGTGFSDKERETPPPIGATITYQYLSKTKNGKPRFASFLRVRSLTDSKGKNKRQE